MTRKSIWFAAAVVLFILPTLTMISCNRSGLGILASIKNEEAIVDRGLPNKVTVGGMTIHDGKYFVAAGSMHERATDGDWTPSPVPDDQIRLSTQVLSWDNSLYAVFFSVEGQATGLYRLKTDGTGWEEVEVDGHLMSEQSDLAVERITAVTSSLFITVRKRSSSVDQYTTYETTDLSSFTSLALDGQTAAVSDAAFFAGSNWILSGNTLYTDTAGSYTRVADAPAPGPGYGGLFSSQLTSRLYLTTADGVIYGTPDGSTWTTLATVTSPEGNVLALYDMEEIEIDGFNVLLIGSSRGYYEVALAGDASFVDEVAHRPGNTDAPVSTSDETYMKIPLRSSVVRFLFVDHPVVFAGTAGSGLWSVNTATQTWSQE